jgi:hypothetical protein
VCLNCVESERKVRVRVKVKEEFWGRGREKPSPSSRASTSLPTTESLRVREEMPSGRSGSISSPRGRWPSVAFK